jgi:hypothetical protein
MIAINFKEKFADLVASGKKTQTIRRTNRFKVGDEVHLTCDERVLGEATVTGVLPVKIRKDYIYSSLFEGSLDSHETYSTKGLNDYAQDDGFKDFEEMKAFLVSQYGKLPFKGYIIVWKLKGGE